MSDKTAAQYNLLMLSGDTSIAAGIDGAFYQMLARFSQYWERIDILTPTANNASIRTIHGNVFVHPATQHRLLQPAFIKQRGEALLREREYHLVVSHDFGFFYNGIGAVWLLQGKQIPLVSEIHHIEGYPIATSVREYLWRFAARRYIPFIAARGAYFRVVNHEVAQQLERWGVESSKIHVLRSVYLDMNLYRPSSTDKQYDVLFVGRLARNKGILYVVEAIRHVKETHPTVKLGIRGEGILKDEIVQFINRHDLHDNIVFVPRVTSSSDMPDLYRSARMLICASTVEGNPRVTVEAMACGVAVISTRVGIMPEIIQDGENGLLVDWDADDIARAIRLLLNDETLNDKISAASRDTVKHLDADSIIHAYASAYHEIIVAHLA